MKSKKAGCLRFTLWGMLVLLILCLVAGGLSAWDNSRLPQRSETLDRLSEREKARFIEAQHLRSALGDQVLPGWAQAEIPVILYNEQYAFLAGAGSPPAPGWVTVPQGQQRGAEWELVPDDSIAGQPYYRQELPAGLTPQAFTVKIGDGYAASLTTMEFFYISLGNQMRGELPGVLQPVFPARIATRILLDSTDQYITLILHESAHAYQGSAAPERLAAAEQAGNNLSNSYPWHEPQFQEAWQSELDMLARALRAETTEETRALAAEFLQIRQDRRQQAGLREELVAFERQREWVEGIGRYAELRVYQLAAQNRAYAPVEAVREDPEFHQYQQFDRRWTREVDQISRMAGDEGDGRFYYSGMAQAVMLDRLDPHWKTRLFAPEIWLEDLLAEALPGSNGR